MNRLCRWLDDLFSPPNRVQDVLRQILPVLEADSGLNKPVARETPPTEQRTETAGSQPLPPTP